MKFMIKRDEDGYFWVYKKRLFLWHKITCATSYERALMKIERLRFKKIIDA